MRPARWPTAATQAYAGAEDSGEPPFVRTRAEHRGAALTAGVTRMGTREAAASWAAVATPKGNEMCAVDADFREPAG
jgi:hypothetical protein